MATITTVQKICDDCGAIQGDPVGWESWSIIQRNVGGVSMDFCPTSLQSLGRKDLIKNYIDSSEKLTTEITAPV